MTTRLYLRSVTVADSAPSADAIPIERFFVNTSNPTEVWVETEARSTPDPGKAALFVLSQNLDIGFRVIRGSVERKLNK
jgi:hypothetical protein